MPTAASDYAALSEGLKNLLGLSGSPVAFRFAHIKDEIPEGMAEAPEQLRHCKMVSMARHDGAVFYATVDRHLCNGGAWALGLRPLTESLQTGDFYFKLGKFSSRAACRRTIDRIPHLTPGETYATLYAPLEAAPFVPEVVLIVATPLSMLKLAQAALFEVGGRNTAEFAGIQSVCADATAQTFLSGRTNFSLGCDGSRKFSGIEEQEMVMGIPAERLPSLVAGLEIVMGAPGSVKRTG
ncbi:MAG TPA: DUF169 domain-containing protein [Methanoregulaceae archaeon]|nr:DUF169 domain-containing protein [Methanoregulaceae archaeon]